MNVNQENTQTPLCVDLDGTLIASDTLWESFLILLRQSPWCIFFVPLWLMRGKSYFKQQITERVSLDISSLPFREGVLSFLQREHSRGRILILATAANEKIAYAVAQHLKIFNEVLASTAQLNLKGSNKRDALIARFGEHKFDYMGDAMADIPIFKAARHAYLVAPSAQLSAVVPTPSERVFIAPRPTLKTWLKALRPHQWVKNSLIFVPLFLAHQLLMGDKLWAVGWAFIAFSLAASAGYVLNDLLDLSADRAHKTKKNRPFAAGLLPLELGLLLFVGLVILSMSIAFLGIHSRFGWVLLLYLVFTLVYSFYLKRKVVLDVIVLAGLYTHRIIAGGIAAHVEISSWLLAFSMFIFMSLAFLKRYVELLQLNEQKEIKNRNYVIDDIDMVASVGPTSGYLAVLVFSLYIQNDATRVLYKSPFILWLICPALLYWITRVWFLARRGQMADDPVQFALTDRVSWWTILLIVALMAIANSFVL